MASAMMPWESETYFSVRPLPDGLANAFGKFLGAQK